MIHAAHVLQNMAGPRAAPWPRCPRCQMGYLIRDLDGDASCYVCGVVIYGRVPDERKPRDIRPKCGRVTL